MNTILIILTSFIIAICITPIVKKIAFHIDAVDKPNNRKGKVHDRAIPRLGGLAVFLAFVVAYLIFGHQDQVFTAILVSSFMIILIGIFDDVKPLPASIKFSGQFIAAMILMLYGGLYIDKINTLGFTITFNWLMYPLTLFFILGAINAINLIDGLDGLSTGISTIFFATIVTIATLLGRTSGSEYIVALIMLGACLAFLFYNFHPAKIFLGDTGSMFLGLIIAAITLSGYKNITFTSLIIPLFLLAIPIMDSLFAIIRRAIKRQKITEADQEHIHHQLLNLTGSQRKTVLIIYLFNILFALASIFYALRDQVMGIIMYCIIAIIVVWLIYKTTIIKDFKKKEST